MGPRIDTHKLDELTKRVRTASTAAALQAELDAIVAGWKDRHEVLCRVAERLAASGTVPALVQFALPVRIAQLQGDGPLDPRVDGVVGAYIRHQKAAWALYARIPLERLEMIFVRHLASLPGEDSSQMKHEALGWVRLAPTPRVTVAFLDYLERNRLLAHLVPGGHLHDAFTKACEEVPAIAAQAEAHAGVRRVRKKRPLPGPFTIVALEQVGTVEAARALEATAAKQLVAAFRRATGATKLKTAEAVLAAPSVRTGETANTGTQYEVRDSKGLVYDLWLVFGDTGTLFRAGTTTRVAVDWIQGEPATDEPKLAPLVESLGAAWRSR